MACTRAGTKVTVRPVIDLNAEMATESYTPTERMVEQVKLRFGECPFPAATAPPAPATRPRDARRQPILPVRSTGRTWTTAREGLRARRCRRTCSHPAAGHHRLKTFTDRTYQYDPATGFTWTSPLATPTPTPAPAATRAATRAASDIPADAAPPPSGTAPAGTHLCPHRGHGVEGDLQAPHVPEDLLLRRRVEVPTTQAGRQRQLKRVPPPSLLPFGHHRDRLAASAPTERSAEELGCHQLDQLLQPLKWAGDDGEVGQPASGPQVSMSMPRTVRPSSLRGTSRTAESRRTTADVLERRAEHDDGRGTGTPS